jgi:hypothetical protein
VPVIPAPIPSSQATPVSDDKLVAASAIELYAIDDLLQCMSLPRSYTSTAELSISSSDGQDASILTDGWECVCLASRVDNVNVLGSNGICKYPMYLDSAATDTFFADKSLFTSL